MDLRWRRIRVRYLQVAYVAESGQDSCAVKFGTAAYAFVQSEDAWLELLELFAFAQDHSSQEGRLLRQKRESVSGERRVYMSYA